MDSDPRSLEYDKEYEKGGFEEAERIMRELYIEYPRDVTPKF